MNSPPCQTLRPRAWLQCASLQAIKAYPHADSHDHYSVTGTVGNVSFSYLGTRRLERDRFPEEIRLTFDKGVYTINTINGQAIGRDYDRVQFGFSLDYPTSPTMHDLRNLGVMHDFRAVLEGRPGTLTHDDLLVNTESAIVLESGQVYDSTKQ